MGTAQARLGGPRVLYDAQPLSQPIESDGFLDIRGRARYKHSVPLASLKPSCRPRGRETNLMKSTFLSFVRVTCLVVFTASAPAQVVICEFMADNKKTLADENGQFPDWLELYNTSGVTVNLAGWALTDDPTHQQLWLFPA